MRMTELMPGDIVNRNPAEPRGWFEVDHLEPLPNGAVAVIAVNEKDSINGAPNDLVGVQVTKVFTVPEDSRPPAAA